jgi:phosphohistidine phosphatase
MLMLTLFRHAKSSWDHPGLDDFNRPLSDRGTNAAPIMARHLAGQYNTLDLILCSTSQRTRQTLALALPYFEPAPFVTYEDGLYLASASDLLARLRAINTDAANVMLIGHNPGFHDLAIALTGSGDPVDRAALGRKFPTAAMALITFDLARWHDITAKSGHLTAFTTPAMVQPTLRTSDPAGGSNEV